MSGSIPTPPYVNATLSTRTDKKRRSASAPDDPDIVVNVYLPPGTSSSSDSAASKFTATGVSTSNSLPHFYRGTRFEGGSMIGPILVQRNNDDKNNHNNNQPWHLHRNCWKFPYNRECFDDIKSANGGRNHGHSEDDRPRRQPETHIVYGNDMWRVEPPAGHDPTWPESGVGLASEFGYGDDGAHCVPTPSHPCGWIIGSSSKTLDYDENDDEERARPLTKIVNGVLGYEEAGAGEPFLKIGVGKLIKGSCAACNATDESAGGYKFNSPYAFYEEPVWTIVKDRPHHLVLEHEATLGDDGEGQGRQHHHRHRRGPTYGYRLKKSMRLDGRVLSVTSHLTNLGKDRFSTPWYSHHFFTCDGIGVGPAGAYGLDLEIRPYTDSTTGRIRYDDSPWATPIAEYAEIREVKHVEEREDSWFDFFSPSWWRKKETHKTMQITITKEVEDGVRIKAEFPSDKGRSKGSFVMHGCGVSVAESIPELQDKLRPSGEAQKSDMSMYAYNLYLERGTLSPEPLYLIELDGGSSIAWTQRVEIGLDGTEVAKMSSSWSEAVEESRADFVGGSDGSSRFANNAMGPLPALFFAFVAAIAYSAIKDKRKRRCKGYHQIPSVVNL